MNPVCTLLFYVIGVAIARNIASYDLDSAPEYFDEFIKTYNKKYDSTEEMEKRYKIFVNNLQHINARNIKSDHAVFGINQFSDLTSEEFLQQHTCYRPAKGLNLYSNQLPSNQTGCDQSAPDQFDWRSKGVVTDVKDQGLCGSCWAFSVIGNIESVYAIKNNKKVVLSEQELVDCDNSNHGCLGGNPADAFIFLTNQGVMTESDYPYTALNGQCKYDSNKANVKISGFHFIKANEEQLKEKLYNRAPLTVVLDATNVQSYTSGIITGNNCAGQNVNHAVLLVGYGTENGVAYWLIKNSWGKVFGENGYFRIQRGVNCVLIMNEHALTSYI